MGNFDYSAFFRRLQDVKKLQIRADDVSWIERHHAPERSYETVLYLGCNILRTPHIAKPVIGSLHASRARLCRSRRGAVLLRHRAR